MKTEGDAQTNALFRAVEDVVQKKPVQIAPLVGAGGYTQALRRIVRFSDDTTAFLKAATSDDTAKWISTERSIYEALKGASFLPAFLGAGETREISENGSEIMRPFLLLEDLSGASWPPPWSNEKVQAVLNALSGVRAAAPNAPVDVPCVEDELAGFASWHLVALDPTLFLSLGLCSKAWLNHALPHLIAAQALAPLKGNDLLHLDVRSDNICFRPGTGDAVLVDWNWAAKGNGTLDIAGWLPSLHSENGPAPETVSQEAGIFAAILSGFWAYRAGLPAPKGAAGVRVVQKAQLTTALPWAARSLGLAPPH